MNFFDDLIVKIAHRLFRGVMVVSTGLVYVQMILLGLLLAGAGIFTVTVLLTVLKSTLLGG